MAGTSPAMTLRGCASVLPGFMPASTSFSFATPKTWMAGTSPAMTLRSCASVLPGFMPASTSLQLCSAKDVDGRNESGHDVEKLCLCLARLYAERDVSVALHVKA